MATDNDTLVQKIAEAVATATVRANIEADEKRGKVVENPRPSQASALNPRGNEPGYTKPTLTRQTMFCGHEERGDQLTPTEIDLYNRIVVPGRYHDRKWVVIIKEIESEPGKETLEIRIPCRNLEDRMAMPPSLTAILSEIVQEQNATQAETKKK